MSELEFPFFYCSKASGAERDLGCEGLFYKQVNNQWVRIEEPEYLELQAAGERVVQGNIHISVKPLGIMEWLLERYTKPGDHVLEPFGGSGTTAIAAMRTGRNCTIVEMNEDDLYRPVIEARLRGWREDIYNNLPPHEVPVIVFEGEMSDTDPNALPDEISLFDFFNS